MSKLHVVQQGQGPALVLSHALGCDLQMWDGVAQALQDRFTVVRYDHRGHGRSPAIGEAFDMNDLADDAAGVIEALDQGPVHFVGLSMGGMTAQALAARHPALVRSITIANSASYYDEAARAGWQARIATVRAQGVAAIADGAMQRWFTPAFHEDRADDVVAAGVTNAGQRVVFAEHRNGGAIGAGRTAQAQVDAARVQLGQGAKGLGHHQRRVVGQHHAARTHTDARGTAGNMAHQHGGG